MNTPPNGVVFCMHNGTGVANNMPENWVFGCAFSYYNPNSQTFVSFQLCYNYATKAAHRLYIRAHDDNVWKEWTAIA